MPGNRCKRPVSIEDIDNFPILLISIDAKLRGRKFGNGGKLTVPQRWFLGGEKFDHRCVDS